MFMTDNMTDNEDREGESKNNSKNLLRDIGVFVLSVCLISGTVLGILFLFPMGGPVTTDVSPGESANLTTYYYEDSERVVQISVSESGDQVSTQIVNSEGAVDARQEHDIEFENGQLIEHVDAMGEWGIRVEKVETTYETRIIYTPLEKRTIPQDTRTTG